MRKNPPLSGVGDYVQQCSEEFSEDDALMYKIYVRQAIEAGLEDSEAGRVADVKDVRAKFGLDAF
ncbi:MAG: hypothetical protein GY749_05845 [Desulfobacteraceae bacterium]|nr:hypothetical protein [Desulfobacteraceae bacterium]